MFLAAVDIQNPRRTVARRAANLTNTECPELAETRADREPSRTACSCGLSPTAFFQDAPFSFGPVCARVNTKTNQGTLVVAAANTGPISRSRSTASAAIDPNGSDAWSRFNGPHLHNLHHRRHDTMEKALLRGEQLKSVAHRYGVSEVTMPLAATASTYRL